MKLAKKLYFTIIIIIFATIGSFFTVQLNNHLTYYFKSIPFKFTSTVSILLFTAYLISKYFHQPNTSFPKFSLPNFFPTMNKFLNKKRFGKRIKQSKEAKFAMKNGGELGGISNDGNTCFMNSVIQSLASSTELIKFIDSYLYEEVTTTSMIGDDDNAPRERKITKINPNLTFTNSLKTMLDNVNGKYGTRGKEFSTRPLLNKMPNGPKQNFFSGYNQEDAQEFYQLVMNIVEKEYKKISSSRNTTPEPDDKSNNNEDGTNFIDVSSYSDLISGCDDLGALGKIYVPASQVDPNLIDAEHKVKVLELITPVDGISVERIGCLTCGEVGGIRYSVVSGLSLNLPNTNMSYYDNFELDQLLNDWINPEIIEDVNCNRCGLQQTKQFLIDKIASTTNEKVIESFNLRLNDINQELSKHCVTDEAFEKLTIKQMIKKLKKLKQIFLSRPPPLLAIHINRSVFDPRTYMIVKNSSKVAFPLKLDLSPYVGEPKDINMDARLPFRKQDERKKDDIPDDAGVGATLNGRESDHDVEQTMTQPGEEVEEKSNEDSSSDDMNSDAKSLSTVATPELNPAIDPKLVYNLKAVISHYGTHNYGHYICYRKLRGTWWRISDESVYVISEDEVLSCPGTFMLFYEFDDGTKEDLIPLNESDFSDDEPEESQKEDSDDEESSQDESGEQDVTDDEPSQSQGPKLNPALRIQDVDDLYDSSGLDSDADQERINSKSTEHIENTSNDEEEVIGGEAYNVGEERAFHM